MGGIVGGGLELNDLELEVSRSLVHTTGLPALSQNLFR